MSVARHGAGTERLEHDLADIGHEVFRLDADVADAGALLRRFEAAPRGILVGTQMVAKGHDFPDVTLGVVVDADGTLRFPDFRAEERTFALVTQLAGRAGRGPARRPRAGADAVARRAVDRRRRPPRRRRLPRAASSRAARRCATRRSRHLIRIVCSSPQLADVRAAAQALRARSATSPRRRCSARRRCSGCAAASARSSSSRPAIGRAAVRAAAPPSRRCARRSQARTRRGLSVDVDPQ